MAINSFLLSAQIRLHGSTDTEYRFGRALEGKVTADDFILDLFKAMQEEAEGEYHKIVNRIMNIKVMYEPGASHYTLVVHCFTGKAQQQYRTKIDKDVGDKNFGMASLFDYMGEIARMKHENAFKLVAHIRVLPLDQEGRLVHYESY